MAKIKPFKAIRPRRDLASLVASRSYVSYSKNSLKDKLDTNPYTFLHIINPDYKDNVKRSRNERFHLVKKKFNEFVEEKILFEDSKESFYIYEQLKNNNRYIGIIACISIDEYLSGNIKIHEETITNREDMFKDYLNITGFNADPVLLTYNDNNIIDNIIEKYSKGRSEYEFTTTNKVSHRLWKISNTQDINKIITSFKSINNIYIADGHHRSSSSALLLEEKRNRSKNLSKIGNENYFMSYLIPKSQLNIINFNRVVKIPENVNSEKILEKIQKLYDLKNTGKTPHNPTHKKEIAMYFKDFWYSLVYKGSDLSLKSENLDASILSREILTPILNIKDEKTNTNISFIEGSIHVNELQKMVDKKEFDIAFILQPIDVNDLITVAENQEIMPPKSTYIHPKLRSGLTIYKIN